MCAPRYTAYTDVDSPAYAPVIAVGFSEVLGASSVTTQSVWLASVAGRVSGTVVYSGRLNQAALTPRNPLQRRATYTVS